MKYKEMNISDNDLRKLSIIKGSYKAPCMMCHDFTEYIDYCTEQYICSTECMDKENRWLNEHCGLYNQNSL